MGVWSSVRKKDRKQILKLDSNVFNCLLLQDVNEFWIQESLPESEPPKKGQKPQLSYPTNFEYSMGGNVEFYKEYLMRGDLNTKATAQYRRTVKQRDISISDHDSDPESFRYVTKYKPVEDIIREQEGGELSFDNYSTIFMPGFLINNQAETTVTSTSQENTDGVCDLDFKEQEEKITPAPMDVLMDRQTCDSITAEEQTPCLKPALTFIYNQPHSRMTRTDKETKSAYESEEASRTGLETCATKKDDSRVKKVKIVKAITKKKIESNNVAKKERASPRKHFSNKQKETRPSPVKKFVCKEGEKNSEISKNKTVPVENSKHKIKHGLKGQITDYEKQCTLVSKPIKTNGPTDSRTNITLSEHNEVDKTKEIIKETKFENSKITKISQKSQSLNDSVYNDRKDQERVLSYPGGKTKVKNLDAIKNGSNISKYLTKEEKVLNGENYLSASTFVSPKTNLFPEKKPQQEVDNTCTSTALDRYNRLPKAFQEMARRLSECEALPKANKPSLDQVKSIPSSNSSNSSNSSPRSPSGRPLSRTPSYKMPKTPSLSRQHPATYVTQHTSRSRSSSRVPSRACSPSRGYENDL